MGGYTDIVEDISKCVCELMIKELGNTNDLIRCQMTHCPNSFYKILSAKLHIVLQTVFKFGINHLFVVDVFVFALLEHFF